MKDGFKAMDSDMQVMERGDENVVFPADYPHLDVKYPHAVETFLELPFSDQTKRKYLWDNCARLYGFGS